MSIGSNGTLATSSIFDQIARTADRGERMLMAAAYYAHHGIPVFPFWIPGDGESRGRKIPCIKDWGNRATTDLEQIREWWGGAGDYCGSLIGAVTGKRSGWGVIDVDVKNGGQGMRSLAILADEIAPLESKGFTYGGLAPEHRLQPVALAETRSGGLHLWYSLNESAAASGVGRIRDLPDIEFKATGQYVAVAPSDGYTWLKELPLRVDDEIPISEYLTKLPSISEELFARVTQKTPAGQNSSGRSIEVGAHGGRINIAKYLASGIPPDEIQDEALRDVAASLASCGRLEHEIVSTLWAIVAVTPLTRPDEPWTDRQLEDKARRAIEYIARCRAQEAKELQAIRAWALGRSRPSPRRAVTSTPQGL